MTYESRLWTAERIAEWIDDPSVVFVCNVSGGKDSTATALLMLEWIEEASAFGVDLRSRVRFVFADTGWEAPETYAYLDALRSALGITIDVVGVPGGMVAKIRDGARFASRMQRWCTRELKVEPLRSYYDRIEAEGKECVCITGIRAEESDKRALMPVVEDDDRWGGWMWRPVREWTVSEVIAIHHRHGIDINPLYRRGHDRVGCYPCVMSSKNDIRLVAEHAPDRIALIRELEREASEERKRRNGEKPGRYAHEEGTFFQKIDRKGRHNGIDDVVNWARTTRGGRQLPLIPDPPDGGCFRWGLCDAPPNDKDGEQ